MVTACGYSCETKSSYDWYGLKRGNANFALFQYTLAGSGCLTYDKTDYLVQPGSAMLLFFSAQQSLLAAEEFAAVGIYLSVLKRQRYNAHLEKYYFHAWPFGKHRSIGQIGFECGFDGGIRAAGDGCLAVFRIKRRLSISHGIV